MIVDKLDVLVNRVTFQYQAEGGSKLHVFLVLGLFFGAVLNFTVKK